MVKRYVRYEAFRDEMGLYAVLAIGHWSDDREGGTTIQTRVVQDGFKLFKEADDAAQELNNA